MDQKNQSFFFFREVIEVPFYNTNTHTHTDYEIEIINKLTLKYFSGGLYQQVHEKQSFFF